MDSILNFLTEKVADFLIGLAGSNPVASLILGGLGTLVFLASVVIYMTPTKTDDDWFTAAHKIPIVGGILTALESLSFVKRK